MAVVIGHHSLNKGAYSDYLMMSEYDYNLSVAELVGCDIIIHDPNVRGYTNRMKDTYRELGDYELTLELHFNAASPDVQGVEALHYHSNMEGKRIADLYCDMIEDDYRIHNRGPKPLNKGDRGYGAVSSGKPTGLILEPFFGSNSECKVFLDIELHACVLRSFIRAI